MKRILFSSVLLCLTGIFEVAMGQVPVITSNPVTHVFSCKGSDAIFTVTASNNPTHYRWQVTYDDVTWTTLIDDATYIGTTTATLTIHTGEPILGDRYQCIASNADGSSTPSDKGFLVLSDAVPAQPRRFRLQQTPVCAGTNDVYFAVGSTGSYTTDYAWTYSGDNVTITHKPGDTAIKVNFAVTATSGLLSMAAVNACGTGPFIILPVTVNPLQYTPAGMSEGGPVCTSYTVVTDGTIYSNPSTCSPISAIIPSGANPVSGSIQSCVTVDASVQTYSGIPYVQRHYSLEPAANPATSTATVTLYFTQADFDAYNQARGSNPALPAGPADATGISNLRITQFHGTGTDPGTYAGGSGDIDPDDNNIVWNTTASRWEVTFDITGFSGFFVSGASLIPLPLTLLNFTGQSVPGGNLLQWTTTAEENTRSFEVQRNSSGNNYQPLATLPAAGNSHQELNYSYIDHLAGNPAASNTYRLKMTDIDGKFTYSKIVVVQSPLTALSIRVMPNPFQQPLSLTISSPEPANARVTVTDLSGKLLLQQNVSLQKGDNNLDPARIAALPKGMYLLSVTTDRQKQTVKLIRE